MKTVRNLIANGLAAALDFCAGAFIAAAVLRYFDIIPLWAPLIGGLIGVSPDADLRTQFKKDGTEVDHHQTVLHFPLCTLPFAVLIGWFLGGAPWAIITGLCLTAHYLHDMAPPFGGLILFGPFSKDFYRIYGHPKHKVGVGNSHREKFMREHNHNYWISTYWQQFSKLSAGELLLATTSVTGVMVLDPGTSFSWFMTALITGAWLGLTFCFFTRPGAGRA